MSAHPAAPRGEGDGGREFAGEDEIFRDGTEAGGGLAGDAGERQDAGEQRGADEIRGAGTPGKGGEGF